MKIRIFENTAHVFSGYGLGPLPDALSCTVIEERNGAYDLDMTYPLNGVNADLIEIGRIIFCKSRPSDTVGEPFRIYNTETDIAGVIRVSAHHISYDLNSEVFLGQVNTTVTGIRAACDALNNNRATGSYIRIWFDGISEALTTPFDIGNICMMSEALGGEGGLLDTFGGELRYQYSPNVDREVVSLCAARGNASPYSIKYGVNMTTFDRTLNGSQIVTDIIAYVQEDGEDETVRRQTEAFALDPSATVHRYMLVDVSGYVEYGASRAEIQAAMQSAIADKALGLLESITASFVPSLTLGIDEQKIGLCDTLKVTYPALDLSVTLEIVRVQYNVLTDHYDRVELGYLKQNVADTIARLEKDVKGGTTMKRGAITPIVPTNMIANGDFSAPGATTDGWSLVSPSHSSISVSGGALVMTHTVTSNRAFGVIYPVQMLAGHTYLCKIRYKKTASDDDADARIVRQIASEGSAFDYIGLQTGLAQNDVIEGAWAGTMSADRSELRITFNGAIVTAASNESMLEIYKVELYDITDIVAGW